MLNLTLRARLMLAVSGAALLLAIVGGLYWKGRGDGVAHERPRAEAALAQAAVAGLETQGARETVQRVNDAADRREAAAAATTKLAAQTLKTEAARATLDPDRVARLRADDLELCRTAPELAGCPAD